MPAVFRLIAALTFAGSALRWAGLYLAASAAAALVSVALVTRVLGRPQRGDLREMLREGSWFALAQSSANVYTDIDKTMLARLGSLPAAGVYAVAYRATAMVAPADLSSTPAASAA